MPKALILPDTNMPDTNLPDDAIIVSYSELDTFRQCPLKHFLAYNLRYTKPPRRDGPLAKGSLYHNVMEAHYKAIVAAQHEHRYQRIPASRHKSLLREIYVSIIKPMLWDERSGEFFDENHELIDWMYQGYVEKYGVDETWKIVAVEHQIRTPLLGPDGQPSHYWLKAKLDLVVQDRQTGMYWVVDHKSGQNLPNHMDLEIDDQFGLYQWAMNQVGAKVVGTIHSANRTTRNTGDWPDADAKYKPQPLDKRMSRTFMSRSKKELVNLALDAYWVARAAYPLPGHDRILYSSPDPRQCGWKCDFKEPHLMMRKGRKMEEVLHEFGFRIDKTRH